MFRNIYSGGSKKGPSRVYETSDTAGLDNASLWILKELISLIFCVRVNVRARVRVRVCV